MQNFSLCFWLCVIVSLLLLQSFLPLANPVEVKPGDYLVSLFMFSFLASEYYVDSTYLDNHMFPANQLAHTDSFPLLTRSDVLMF